MAELLSDDQLDTITNPQPHYQYIQPFSDVADSLIDLMQNEEGRFMFGIMPLDAKIRGVGRGELCMVTGRSHSGKTQLVLQMVANNPDKRILFFTPDEVSEMVLIKLVSISRLINAEQLEEKVKAKDPEAIKTIRSVAAYDFPNLIVIDRGLTFTEMTKALNEAEDFWQAQCDVVVLDYLELMPGEAEYSGTIWKSQELKRWTKTVDVSTICLRQSTRSGGPRGKSGGMDAMAYGGESEAIYVLEVYRKADNPDLGPDEKRYVENTVTVNVAKNKRPPSKKGSVDLWLDPDCGRIRERELGEGYVSGTPVSSKEEAFAAIDMRRNQLHMDEKF